MPHTSLRTLIAGVWCVAALTAGCGSPSQPWPGFAACWPPLQTTGNRRTVSQAGPINYRSSRSRCRWLLAVLVVGASLTLRAERLPIKTYATSDGFAHNTVNRIAKDSRGFLWFCTAGGLSRFDGYGFTNFGTRQGLPNSSVNDLLETRAGEYWVATGGGLVRFDPKGRPTPPGAPCE